MANRISQELNNIRANASAVEDFYSKRYISAQGNIAERIGDRTESFADVNMYYKVSGCDFLENTEENDERVLNVTKSIVSSAGTFDVPLAFNLVNDETGTQIFYGTRFDFAEQIKSVLCGNYCSAQISNEWLSPAKLENIQAYNGFISGITQLPTGAIDRVINSLQLDVFMLNAILRPVSGEEISEELNKINFMLDSFQRVSQTELNIGSGRARKFDNDNHNVLQTMKVLSKEKARLEQGLISGLWQTIVHISSDREITYRKVAALIAAAFHENVDYQKDNTLITLVDVNNPVVNRNIWTFPADFLGNKDYGGLYSKSLATVVDLDTAASLVAIPVCSHKGYSVRYLGSTSGSNGVFAPYQRLQNEPGQFVYGCLDNGSPFRFPLSALRQHAFVTGATQFGKSTSVKSLLTEAHREGVPFVVIEASKKEYWKLLGDDELASVRVYSMGQDAIDLQINPFQPEENTILDTHIQNIIQAFLTLFEGTDPIPQILSDLIYMCYEKKGWDVSKRVSAVEDLDYPTLTDMLENYEECIRNIGYGEETKQDMRGVFKVRLSYLMRQAGKTLNTEHNNSIAEMFSTSAIIELDDIADRNKAFFASLIAIKSNEYAKQCNMDGRLSRLLVLEEAHHLIPNVEMRSITPNAIQCSNYFTTMLAEISAYGTGVIIVDQRPSYVSSAALANTGMKIVHNIREGEDIKTIARSLAMSEESGKLLNILECGQAVITLPQTSELCKVRVKNMPSPKLTGKLGRLFGVEDDKEIEKYISSFEREYMAANGFSAASMSFCIRTIENRFAKTLTRSEKIQIASLLVEISDDNAFIKRQKIYQFAACIS